MQAHATTPYSLGRPGLVIAGRYQLVAPIGQGAMGEVWRALHTSLNTTMAIKLVGARVADEESGARFSREARAAAALKSRHVVQVFDHGSEQGLHYLAMELLEGETLAERLVRVAKLPDAAGARIIVEIARGVGRAHQLGVVHRDLKPANVFLARTDDGETSKILDFGIAKLASSYGGFQTRSGESMGTPAYMSPEQVMGSDVDYRSDLWQVAIIAFETLTGKLPYEASTAGELMSQIATRRLKVPTDVCPQLPRSVDDWFARATALDRNRRFESAEALADALSRAFGQPTSGLSVTSPPPPPEERQRHALIALVVGLACLAVALLVLVVVTIVGSRRSAAAAASASAQLALATSSTPAPLPSPPPAVSVSAPLVVASSAAPSAAPSASSARPPPSATAQHRRVDPWGF